MAAIAGFEHYYFLSLMEGSKKYCVQCFFFLFFETLYPMDISCCSLLGTRKLIMWITAQNQDCFTYAYSIAIMK